MEDRHILSEPRKTGNHKTRLSPEEARERRRIRARTVKRHPIYMTDRCKRCRSKDRLQRHHPDYNQPDLIELLCWRCHRLAVHGHGAGIDGPRKMREMRRLLNAIRERKQRTLQP